MNITDILQSIAAAVATLGGWEAVKYALHLRQNRRIVEARADTDELHVVRETIEFLQQQLADKEKRFAEQTTVVRTQNDSILDLTRQRADLELQLARRRCDDDACPFRLPPNAYTPAIGTIKREDYFTHRQQNEQS